MIARLRNYLFEPEDNAPIILFRILFGFLAFCEVAGAILTGWVHETFIEPQYHLPFIGFEWINLPSDATVVYSYYALMALAALGIMLGAYYRVATLAFALFWWGSYLMQKIHYNNHYYLIILLAFFMLVIPANRYASWDVKRNPYLRQYTCPRWCSLIFIVQVCIVFIFAALAKINPDWLAGKPIEVWFATKTHYPVVGSLFAAKWFRDLVTYGGIAFDLLITPLLLWRRTRTAAFIVCIGFNLFNSFTFQIGGFPYLMIALTLFFFPGETIRKRFFKRKSGSKHTRAGRGASVFPIYNGSAEYIFHNTDRAPAASYPDTRFCIVDRRRASYGMAHDAKIEIGPHIVPWQSA